VKETIAVIEGKSDWWSFIELCTTIFLITRGTAHRQQATLTSAQTQQAALTQQGGATFHGISAEDIVSASMPFNGGIYSLTQK
jgi:hypothetical protein